MKKVLFLSLAFVTAFAVNGALADTGIEANGDLGENTVLVNNTLKVKIDIDEKNKVDVYSSAKANTGHNSIEAESADGAFSFGGDAMVKDSWQMTGSALAESHVDTDTGTTKIDLDVDESCECGSTGIEDNGDANVNDVEENNETKVKIDLDLKNKVEVDSKAKADTGYNEIEAESADGDFSFGGDSMTKGSGTTTGNAAGGSWAAQTTGFKMIDVFID